MSAVFPFNESSMVPRNLINNEELNG